MAAEPDGHRRSGRARRLSLLGAALAAAFAALPLSARGAEPGASAFVAHALALRAAAIRGEADGVLAEIPGAGRAGGAAQLRLLWAPFFDNAIVAAGRAHAPAPVALYYNPLLDAALLTAWERRDGRWLVASVRALPF